MQELWGIIWEVVTSLPAQRAATLTALLLAIVGSGFVAKEVSGLVTGVPSTVTFLGRKPTRSKTIKRRLDAARSFRAMMLKRQVLWLSIAILFGVIVPATVLFAFLSNYSWIVGEGSVFVSSCPSGACSVQPSKKELWVYVVNQTSSALIADVIRQTLGLPTSRIAHDEGNIVATSAIVIFRLYMQLYVANWLRASLKGLWNFFTNSKAIEETINLLTQDYNAALAAGR